MTDTPDFSRARYREILKDYQAGLYLRAYSRFPRVTKPDDLPDASWRLLGGRMMARLGAGRLAQRWFLAAQDVAPEHPAVRYHCAFLQLRRHWGRMIEHLDGHRWLPGATSSEQADWMTFQAYVFKALRLRDEASRLADHALRLCCQEPWPWVVRAEVHMAFDELPQAGAACRQALERERFFRPAVLLMAEWCHRQHRPDEAFGILAEADQATESYEIALQLALVGRDQGRYLEAERALERARRCAPLATAPLRRALLGFEADLALLQNDYERALALAEAVGAQGYYAKLAERLRARKHRVLPATLSRRLALPLPAVRQHWNTCVPAASAMVLLMQGEASVHEAMSRAVVYEGTHRFLGRRWLEARGFQVRFFVVDERSARALLELGIPFTMTVRDTDSAHEVVVYGFDERAGVLLVRDPSVNVSREWPIEALLDRPCCHGPIGTVILARRGAASAAMPDLRGLEDMERLWELWRALDEGRFESAARAAQAWPDPPEAGVRYEARLVLSQLDPARARRLGRSLVETFPDDPVAAALGIPWDDEESAAVFGQRVSAAAKKWRDSALVLAEADFHREGAHDDEAERAVLDHALERTPLHADTWISWSAWLWRQGEAAPKVARAAEIALALRPADDRAATLLGAAYRLQNKPRQALTALLARHRDLRHKHHEPTLALASHLLAEGRRDAALRLVERCHRRHQGTLAAVIALGWWLVEAGESDRAARWLDDRRPVEACPPWLYPRAWIDYAAARFEAAASRLDALLALRVDWPGALTLRAQVGQILDGGEAARRRIDDLAPTPASLELARAKLEALRALDERAAAFSWLSAWIEAHPESRWGWQEFSFEAFHHRDRTALRRAQDRLDALEPKGYAALVTAMHLDWLDYNLERAHDTAIRLCDRFFASPWVFDAALSTAQHRDLKTVIAELIAILQRRRAPGDCVQAVISAITERFPDPDGTRLLEQAAQALIHHPKAALACAWRSFEERRDDDARAWLARLHERFPSESETWLVEQALAERAGDDSARRHALERLAALAGHQAGTHHAWGWYHETQGRPDQAEAAYAQAAHREPRNAEHVRRLAAFIQDRGRKAQAADMLRQALFVVFDPQHLYPALAMAWRDLGKEADLDALTERLIAHFPRHEALRAAIAADLILQARPRDAAALLERALQGATRPVALHEQWAMALGRLGRCDEARAAFAEWKRRWPEESLIAWTEALWLRQFGSRADREDFDALAHYQERWPHDVDALRLRAEWHYEDQRWAELEDDAGELARRCPSDPVALGYLAQAQHSLERTDAAVETMLGALERDPYYRFAAIHRPLWMLSARMQPDISSLSPLLEADPADAEALVVVALARDPRQVDEETLQRLFTLENANPDRSHAAGELLAGFQRDWPWLNHTLRAFLTRALRRVAKPLNRPFLEALAPALFEGRKSRRFAYATLQCAFARRPQDSALLELLAPIAIEGTGPWRLTGAINADQKLWRQSDRLWGMALRVQALHGNFGSLITWAREWWLRQWPGPGPLALVLDRLEAALRTEDLLPLVQAVAQRFPQPDAAWDLRAALIFLVNDRIQDARAHFERIAPSALSDNERLLYDLLNPQLSDHGSAAPLSFKDMRSINLRMFDGSDRLFAHKREVILGLVEQRLTWGSRLVLIGWPSSRRIMAVRRWAIRCLLRGNVLDTLLPPQGFGVQSDRSTEGTARPPRKQSPEEPRMDANERA